MRVIRKMFSYRLVAPGSDQVVAFMPIAPRGSFHGMRGQVHVHVTDLNKQKVVFFPARVYACQMTEIDDLVDSIDDLWDRYIPKDDDVSEVAATIGIDVARDTEDAGTFDEPGESSPNELFGVKEPSTLLWRRDEFISLASSPVGFEGAAVDTYSAVERYSMNIRRRIDFPQGGFVALGIGSPGWDDVTTSIMNGMQNLSDLMTYANLPDFLHVARLALIGATEAGAETPFVDVLSLIEELTEPTVMEVTAGKYEAATAEVWSRVVFDVGVPENPDTQVLKSD